MEQIILFAFEQWNRVPGSYLHLGLISDENITSDSEDKIHSLVIKSESSLTTAAYAVPITRDGKIIDCDISITDQTTSAKSLAYTLIHEVGHCVGLGHAHSNYGAIMGYARQPVSLSLGADDMAGIIYLYMDPDYDGPIHEFLGCAAVGIPKNGMGGFVLYLLLLFPLLILMLMRVVAYRRSGYES